MHGVSGTDIESQLAFVRSIAAPYTARFAEAPFGSPRNVHDLAIRANCEGGYGPIEAETLYSFARAKKPARIVQVGCGVSTAVLLQAMSEEPGYSPTITCIEPYPTPVLTESDRAGRITLRAERAQDTPIEFFQSLAPGDLLFIDSTHTTKAGSEVLRIVLEIMPRLPAGVFVHFHDIYFPYDYSPHILEDELFFWRETVLLYAFLINNSRCRVCASLAMLHHERSAELKALFPGYKPAEIKDGIFVTRGHYPSAIYLVTS